MVASSVWVARVIHQKWELPAVSPLIFEYRLFAVALSRLRQAPVGEAAGGYL